MMKEKSLLQEWIILAIAISISGFYVYSDTNLKSYNFIVRTEAK